MRERLPNPVGVRVLGFSQSDASSHSLDSQVARGGVGREKPREVKRDQTCTRGKLITKLAFNPHHEDLGLF